MSDKIIIAWHQELWAPYIKESLASRSVWSKKFGASSYDQLSDVIIFRDREAAIVFILKFGVKSEYIRYV